MNEKYERKLSRFLVMPRLQLMMILWMVLWSAILLLIVMVSLLPFYNKITTKLIDLGYSPESKEVALFNELFQDFSSFMMWAGFAVIIASLLWGVVFSHRMAGPIYKISEFLKKDHDKKSLKEDLQVRKDDAFKDFVDLFNKFKNKNLGN